MINIIHVNIHCNDRRKITAVEVKLKSFKEESKPALSGHPLVATVSAAFYNTTLLTDVGKQLITELNPKRTDIVNLTVRLKETDLAFEDVSKFVEYLQKSLDNTHLF